MRNLRLLALVAPVFLLPLACEDSSGSSSGATFNPEAGSFEAGPSPEGGSPTPEAGLPDVVPPAPLGVTVTVLEDLLPKSNVRVILQDASGDVTGEKTTDATGKVTLATAPGMVTVLTSRGTGAGSSVAPVTFVGVADGDKLVVAASADVQVDPVVVGTYTASFTNAGLGATATYFNVLAGMGCGGNTDTATEPAVVSLYPSCLAAKNALLAVTSDNSGISGFAFAKDLAKPPAGPPAGNIDVGPLAVSAPGSTKLAATNVSQSVNTYGQLYAIANGALFEMAYYDGFVESANGADFKTPTGFAEAYQTRVEFNSYNAQSTSLRTSVRREAVPANGVLTSVDFTTALPAVTNAQLTKTTPTRPDVTLTAGGALTSADGAVAVLHWDDPNAETSGSWTFVLPPSATAFKAPALPANATTFLPTINVTVDEVIFVEATQLPGYKELKLLPVRPNLGLDAADTNKPLPAPGTVRVSRWFPGIPG